VHSHGAQVRQAQKLARLYGLTTSDRSFTNMPFFWVGGLTVVLLAHMEVGAAVIAVQRNDSAEMLDLIEETRPTRLVGWTLVERLEADPTFAQRDLTWLAGVHRQPAVDPASRHNSLGMSETSGPHTAASSSENQSDLPDELRGSFGPAVAGMQHKIVDPDTGATLADSLEGEICVRGEGLMVGLHKKEHAEVFDDDGWYHTGDRGSFRDGFLFFTGRLSEMIKTAGANVAPREVELAVAGLSGVKAAFVRRGDPRCAARRDRRVPRLPRRGTRRRPVVDHRAARTAAVVLQDPAPRVGAAVRRRAVDGVGEDRQGASRRAAGGAHPRRPSLMRAAGADDAGAA